MKILSARRVWIHAFHALKEYYGQPRVIIPEKLSAMNEGEKKILSTS